MKVNEADLATYISHYKQTASARKKIWEMKHIQNKVQRPSMRRCTSGMGSLSLASDISSINSDTASCLGDNCAAADTEIFSSRSSTLATGGGAALGVSVMNFDQHSSLIRCIFMPLRHVCILQCMNEHYNLSHKLVRI